MRAVNTRDGLFDKIVVVMGVDGVGGNAAFSGGGFRDDDNELLDIITPVPTPTTTTTIMKVRAINNF